jgi:hypothetical protein
MPNQWRPPSAKKPLPVSVFTLFGRFGRNNSAGNAEYGQFCDCYGVGVVAALHLVCFNIERNAAGRA